MNTASADDPALNRAAKRIRHEGATALQGGSDPDTSIAKNDTAAQDGDVGPRPAAADQAEVLLDQKAGLEQTSAGGTFVQDDSMDSSMQSARSSSLASGFHNTPLVPGSRNAQEGTSKFWPANESLSAIKLPEVDDSPLAVQDELLVADDPSPADQPLSAEKPSPARGAETPIPLAALASPRRIASPNGASEPVSPSPPDACPAEDDRNQQSPSLVKAAPPRRSSQARTSMQVFDPQATSSAHGRARSLLRHANGIISTAAADSQQQDRCAQSEAATEAAARSHSEGSQRQKAPVVSCVEEAPATAQRSKGGTPAGTEAASVQRSRSARKVKTTKTAKSVSVSRRKSTRHKREPILPEPMSVQNAESNASKGKTKASEVTTQRRTRSSRHTGEPEAFTPEQRSRGARKERVPADIKTASVQRSKRGRNAPEPSEAALAEAALAEAAPPEAAPASALRSKDSRKEREPVEAEAPAGQRRKGSRKQEEAAETDDHEEETHQEETPAVQRRKGARKQREAAESDDDEEPPEEETPADVFRAAAPIAWGTAGGDPLLEAHYLISDRLLRPTTPAATAMHVRPQLQV